MWTAIHRSLLRWFGPKPDWQAQATLVFTDSKGYKYFKYEDELRAPIARMDACDVVIKEIENRVSMLDLRQHVDNHNRILLSDQKPQDKIKQLADHTRWLEERLDIPPAPKLLMKIPALFYIREDENPFVLDNKIWQEKVTQFLADTEGSYTDFFIINGLREYLPLSITSTKNTEELLMRAQQISDKLEKAEKELQVALS